MSSTTAERLTIAGPGGALQLLVESPETDALGVTVVCHPHPLHGGTMDNKVAYTLARTMNLLGRTAVRFNFRGVGESAGTHDDGRGEREDVLAVIKWAAERYPGLPLWLAGFSFGACMAAAAADEAGVEQLVLVAPAADRYGMTEVSVAAPLVLAQGMADDVVSPEAALQWARRQEGEVTVLEFADVGHFFHGAQVSLRSRLLEALGAPEGGA
ncbi:MAG: alpha/beta fold hydrolase [Pseudomonadota bacterium]